MGLTKKNTPHGNTRGGARVGAGRPKENYTTITKSFRIRSEIEKEFVRKVKDLINRLTPPVEIREKK